MASPFIPSVLVPALTYGDFTPRNTFHDGGLLQIYSQDHRWVEKGEFFFSKAWMKVLGLTLPEPSHWPGIACITGQDWLTMWPPTPKKYLQWSWHDSDFIDWSWRSNSCQGRKSDYLYQRKGKWITDICPRASSVSTTGSAHLSSPFLCCSRSFL